MRKALPTEAQTIWRSAFNSAHGEGKSEEEAIKIAWGAVKKIYEKNEQGTWVKKEVLCKDRGFITKSEERRYTLGIVYEPNVPDTDGDFATAPEIEKACWKFNKMLQGNTAINKTALQLLDTVVKAVIEKQALQLDVTDVVELVQKNGGTGLGYAHALWSDDIGDIVESYIAPCDMVIDGQQVRKGTWLMGTVWSPSYYEKVKTGEITGYSMGGTGVRIPVSSREGGESGAGT